MTCVLVHTQTCSSEIGVVDDCDEEVRGWAAYPFRTEHVTFYDDGVMLFYVSGNKRK